MTAAAASFDAAAWPYEAGQSVSSTRTATKFPNAYVGDLVPNGNQESRYLYRSARTALWVRPKRWAASITVRLRSSAISISLSVQGAL
ncbi:Uncharacterised protein [Mycobacteroides abscessus subsp. massiliense]|nr:Uncharacterised protein [Mycobacteroides abscessus subsp. massiliense]